MDKKKNLSSSKIIPIAIIICSILLVAGVVGIKEYEKNKPLKETNWAGLVRLGLAPNTYPRAVTPLDKDTGLRFNTQYGTIALIESGNFATKDFGKTFILGVK